MKSAERLSRETEYWAGVSLTRGWMDIGAGTLHVGGRRVDLTATEHALLQCLVDAHPEPVSQAELLQSAWGYRSGVTSETVKTTVLRIRRKLGADRGALQTVRGKGYRLDLGDRLPPTGTVTLVAIIAQPHSAGGRSTSVVDRILRDVEGSAGFAFLDAPLHLGLAFEDPDEAVRWALEVQAVPEHRVAIAISSTDSGLPPTYEGPGRERCGELARSAPWGAIALDEGVRIGAEASARLHAWRVSRRTQERTPPQVPRRTVRLVPVEEPAPVALPEWRSTWIERKSDRQRIEGLFDSGARLVTITGTGGVGKTRLAAQLMRGHNALFVDLTGCEDLDGVLATLASAGARRVAAVGALERLVHDLGTAHERVVLDNAEHAPRAVGFLADRWLDADVPARLLVTSRIRLDVGGEQVHRLLPLDPSSARRLFCDRASAVVGQPIEDDDRVASLVERLDRLPLALELAAAQVPALGVQGVIDGLEHRFELLQADAEDNPRHGALDDVIRESWERLEPADRRALVWCAVFEGPVPPGEVVSVLRAVQKEPVARLSALARASMTQTGADGTLYLLESVREFVRHQPLAREEARAAREAHTRWALALTVQHPSMGVGAWRRRILALEPEIHAAIEHQMTQEPASALDALEVLTDFMDVRGFSAASWHLASRVCAQAAHFGPGVHARALFVRGRLARSARRAERARVDMQDAYTLARTAGDTQTEVRALLDLALLRPHQGEAGIFVIRELLPRLEAECPPDVYVGALLSQLHQMSSEEADATLDRAEALAVGSERLRLRVMLSRCRLASGRAQWGRLLSLTGPTRRFALELGSRWRAAYALMLEGKAYVELGQFDSGVATLERALAESAAIGEPDHNAKLILAKVMQRYGDLQGAAESCQKVVDARFVHGWDRERATCELGNVRLLQGQVDSAIAVLRTTLERVPRWIRLEYQLPFAMALARTGQVDRAEEIVVEVERRATGGPAKVLAGPIRAGRAAVGLARARAKGDSEAGLERARISLAELQAEPAFHMGVDHWRATEFLRTAIAAYSLR